MFFAFITLEFIFKNNHHHQKVIFVKSNAIKHATDYLHVKKVFNTSIEETNCSWNIPEYLIISLRVNSVR